MAQVSKKTEKIKDFGLCIRALSQASIPKISRWRMRSPAAVIFGNRVPLLKRPRSGGSREKFPGAPKSVPRRYVLSGIRWLGTSAGWVYFGKRCASCGGANRGECRRFRPSQHALGFTDTAEPECRKYSQRRTDTRQRSAQTTPSGTQLGDIGKSFYAALPTKAGKR